MDQSITNAALQQARFLSNFVERSIQDLIRQGYPIHSIEVIRIDTPSGATIVRVRPIQGEPK